MVMMMSAAWTFVGERLGELSDRSRPDSAMACNDGGVDLAGGLRSRRHDPTLPAGLVVEQDRGHLGPAGVVDADEEHLRDIGHERGLSGGAQSSACCRPSVISLFPSSSAGEVSSRPRPRRPRFTGFLGAVPAAYGRSGAGAPGGAVARRAARPRHRRRSSRCRPGRCRSPRIRRLACPGPRTCPAWRSSRWCPLSVAASPAPAAGLLGFDGADVGDFDAQMVRGATLAGVFQQDQLQRRLGDGEVRVTGRRLAGSCRTACCRRRRPRRCR